MTAGPSFEAPDDAAAAAAGEWTTTASRTETDGPPDWLLSPSQRDDLDLLVTGGYAPLDGFLTRAQVSAVQTSGRLPDGRVWPTPVTLEVDVATARAARSFGRLTLRDQDQTVLAVLTVHDTWDGDGGSYLGGPIASVRPPAQLAFAELRRPVPVIRDELGADSRPVVVAQPSGAVDRRTAARWSRAGAAIGARLLLFPPVGTDPERQHIHRIRAYRRLLEHLPEAHLRLLPSGHRPDVPAAVALHAAVARNAGASHLLLGNEPVDLRLIDALGLVPVDPAEYARPDDPPPGVYHDEVALELDRADPPRSQCGLVIMLTGLSGSGKSTIAQVLRARLMEAGDRAVTLLDGDLVRQHLSRGLGFSRQDRDLNVRRIGFVASEISRHGGLAICAPIAPYDTTRRAVRSMVDAAGGGFVLVHVATPLEVCEARDVKGLYARARAGEVTGFTGIDDPYEEPTDAEVVVDTASISANAAADRILDHLAAGGWYDRR